MTTEVGSRGERDVSDTDLLLLWNQELEKQRKRLEGILTVSDLADSLNLINRRIAGTIRKKNSSVLKEEFNKLTEKWANVKHLALLGALQRRANGERFIMVTFLSSGRTGIQSKEMLVFRIADAKRDDYYTKTAKSNIAKIIGLEQLDELIGTYDTFAIPPRQNRRLLGRKSTAPGKYLR